MFLLTLHNGHSKAEKSGSENDEFTREDISDVVDLWPEAMALGAHELIFCASIQIGGWYLTVLGQKEEISNDEPMEGKEGVVQKRLFGGDEVTALRKGTWEVSSDPKPKWIGYTSGHEIVVRFWKTGLWYADILERSNYQTAGCIRSRHTSWTDEMNNIPRL